MAKKRYLLSRPDRQRSDQERIGESITATKSGQGLAVDTGKACFHISGGSALFRVVKVGKTQLVGENGPQIRLTDSTGHPCLPSVESIQIEESGPLKLIVRIDGVFKKQNDKPICRFRSRLGFFAGMSLVEINFQIHNPRAAIHPGGVWDLGDPGSIYFRDLSLSFVLNNDSDQLSASCHIYETPVPEERYSTIPFNPTALTNLTHFTIYQDSSGGANWNSSNHVDKDGKLTVSFPGYRVFSGKSQESTIKLEGRRATPYVNLSSPTGWIAAGVKDFWQNFPKALQVEGSRLRVGLFPAESKSGFELQGGEKKRHTIFLDFGTIKEETIIPQMLFPLHVSLDPEWVEQTGAVSNFVPESFDQNREYLNYIHNIIDGPNSFFSKREIVDEYGWRSFGDLYGDHEAVNHKGPGVLVSHYNNQYDFIYGSFFQFLRTGDRRWFQLMSDVARHTIDIDIYHTDEDKAAYSHGLFWHTDHYKDAATCTHRTYSRRNGGRGYGGGPSNEHNYTSGLLHYHYLTGDPEAKDAVLELANWVMGMDDGSQTLLGLVDGGPTGGASSTVDVLYHKPGRGAGNSINALMDAYRLTNDRKYMFKAEELIQRCIHSQDDIAALKLDEPEYRWSYLVFLQVLGKYLDFKVELGEKDYLFFYARDSLLHYAEWMAANEVPYKDVLHKVEIPTETWPAHDIRKCHVFHQASKHGQPEKRSIYKQKADFFFDRCLVDLLTFTTAYLTRPMVILAVYGYTHAYFQKIRQNHTDFQPHGYDFGTPEIFQPQKARIKLAISKKFGIIAENVTRLAASWWWEMKQKYISRRAHRGQRADGG